MAGIFKSLLRVCGEKSRFVADDDGIAVIDIDEAEALLKQVQDRFSSTPSTRKWIAKRQPLKDHPETSLLKKKAKEA